VRSKLIVGGIILGVAGLVYWAYKSLLGQPLVDVGPKTAEEYATDPRIDGDEALALANFDRYIETLERQPGTAQAVANARSQRDAMVTVAQNN
jgi:hypothetical protein